MANWDSSEETKPAGRGPVRRHALPVLLGIVLGIASLALLRVLGVDVFLPFWPGADEPGRGGASLPVSDERLRGVMGEGLLEMSDEAGGGLSPMAVPARGEPWREPAPEAACEGPVDCLVKRTGSAWEVRLSANEVEPVEARIAARLTSAQSGLLTFFVVEPDDSVLRIYPTPDGDVPVVSGGEELHLPRRHDRLRLRWSESGPRRLVAVLSTEPFIPPAGEGVAGLLTYYDAESGASDAFFAALEERIAADHETGKGAWSVAVAEIEVVEVETVE